MISEEARYLLSVDEQTERYISMATASAQEVKATIDRKVKALEEHNFSEAYRLSGLISLMAQECETLDRRMWVLMNPGEADEQAAE